MHSKDFDRLLETKQHGSALFPFNIYPCSIPVDFPAVALHWQQSMELIYIKKGRGLVQSGLQMTEARKGDIFIVAPGTIHALRELPGQTMEYENIIFDMRFLGSGAADICAQEYLVPLSVGQLRLPTLIRQESIGYDRLSACLAEAEDLCGERGPGYELGVKAAILRFLFLLLRLCPEKETAEPGREERLQHILQKIEEEFAQPLTVAEAARECGLSSSHFMRWFRQMIGSSFTAYLNERRLAAAAGLLKQTDATILTIAEQVGFENLSNFNRQFKARYGMTPRRYRSR